MKKYVGRILLVTGILLGIIIIGAALFLINFLSATKSMTPAETGALNDSVWCVKDRFVNAYIFRGEKSYLMVDAGLSKKGVEQALQKIGILPGKITTLLLTHTDGDHIGATGLLTNPSIYMHVEEKQMIDGTTGKSKFMKTKWKYGPYILLKDRDSLTIDGLTIRILHTPGHTPGSSCYIIGDDYLVTGDNLAFDKGQYAHFTEMFNMDTPKQEESISKLPPPSDFRYILTAHNGIIRNIP
jgi:glyoxylase-like metal-dependent hydrolase (beta-lactamase superfamily II)